VAQPNWHFNHIPDDVVPALLERGVTQSQVDQMLIGNPCDLFEKQGAY
ncbi:MAG: phosphotriesterase-related protein, partial [Chloroflexi bacterium]|nr:phosphotriesterase-related protein [Chloroflexota bacterium]